MLYTSHLNLKKPEVSDFFNIKDFNDNAETIDAKIEEIEEKAFQKKEVVTEVSSNVQTEARTTVNLQKPLSAYSRVIVVTELKYAHYIKLIDKNDNILASCFNGADSTRKAVILDIYSNAVCVISDSATGSDCDFLTGDAGQAALNAQNFLIEHAYSNDIIGKIEVYTVT